MTCAAGEADLNVSPAMLSHDYRSLIAPPDLLARLTGEERSVVRGRAVQMDIPVGRGFFRQDDPCTGIFLITEGLVRVFYVSRTGREITLGYWSRGHFAGGPEVFGRGSHLWSGEAVSPTRALFLAGQDVEELVRTIPNFAVGVIDGLVFKGKCYSALCRILGTHSVIDRLVLLLRLLGELRGERLPQGILLSGALTHEDLAHLVGATRQWVTIALRRLERKDLIARSQRRLILRPSLYAWQPEIVTAGN